jgi:two-component system, LytTR family, sensor kinase
MTSFSAKHDLVIRKSLQRKNGVLQIPFLLYDCKNYFSIMTRKQLVVVYAIVIFMMVWGLDLIAIIKVKRPIALRDVLNVFTVSQIIYITTTLLLTRFFFKKYFLAKRYDLLAISGIGLMLFFILLRYTLEEVIAAALFGYHNYNINVSFNFYVLDNIYYALIYVVLGFLIFLLDNQIATQKSQALLIQKTREAELLFLRSQINPHFLFNTLNNIYSLVYERSPKAPEAVLKLAELMRYLLYEQKEKVPLTREWEYVQNFIALQRLRFPQELPVELKVEGAADRHEIIPHLLICFIENAFKHGDFKDPSAPLKVRLYCNGSTLKFETENKVSNHHKDETGGVGLENIQRRLDLLYPKRYSLQIKNDGHNYSSLLTLNSNEQ